MIAFDLILSPTLLSCDNEDISVPSRFLETTRYSSQALSQVALPPDNIQ